MDRAGQARALWAAAQTDAVLQGALRAVAAGPDGLTLLDLIWWCAHPLAPTPSGRPDPAVELAELARVVYSRDGSAESVADIVDPVSGEAVRATPSEHRLRALRAERSRREAILDDALEEFGPRPARPMGKVPAALPAALPALEPALDPPAPHPRRRFALPLVAAGAFAAGILTGLAVISVQGPGILPASTPTATPEATPDASDTAALLIFNFPTQYPFIDLPELGDRFMPDSIRNVSGTSPGEDGFGVFLGREAGSGLYCLIVHTEAELTMSSCATADDVAQSGLVVRAAVTVRTHVAHNSTLGDTELTAELSPRGEFSMGFPTQEPWSVPPPVTPGTPLGSWTSGSFFTGGTADARGEGLIVALDCVGEGSVTVILGRDDPRWFQCAPGRVENFEYYDDTPHAEFAVTVNVEGNVVWGLTIASTPVSEPAQR